MQMYLSPDADKEQPEDPDGKKLIHFSGPDCFAQHAAWNEKRQLNQVI